MNEYSFCKNGRKLVWQDDFGSADIDASKWCFSRTMYTPGRVYDNGRHNCRIEDGMLHLAVNRHDNPQTPFTLSEGITTKSTMNFKYGYLEARAKLPFRHGAWPSFWMKTDTPYAKADFMAVRDFFVVVCSENAVGSNLHKWQGGKHTMLPGGEGSPTRAYVFKDSRDLNNEFHLYGMDWNEQSIGFYVDGCEYTRFAITDDRDFGTEVIRGMGGFHDFAYIIFNNEIFTELSPWKPEGAALTEKDEMPIDYDIDWVRLYQNPDFEELILPKNMKEG